MLQERRGGILPADNGRMLPAPMLPRNDRPGTLAPGAVLARSERGGVAPPLQPPPVPPAGLGMDRPRQQALVSETFCFPHQVAK
jgi:hypothetical protein